MGPYFIDLVPRGTNLRGSKFNVTGPAQESGIKVVSDCTCVTTDLGGVARACSVTNHSFLLEVVMCIYYMHGEVQFGPVVAVVD